MKGAIMKNSKNPCGNYEVQFKNDICIIRGITYLGYLALTCFAYDSDIRIPCVVVEKRGMVRCMIFEQKYTLRFISRAIVMVLKYLITPHRKFKAIIEALISE